MEHIGIERLTEHRGARDGAKQQGALLLDQRQDGRRLRRAGAVKDHEHLVVFQQLARVLDGLLRVESIVERGVTDHAAMHPALRVHRVEQQSRALSVLCRLRPQRPRQHHRCTQPNFISRHTFIAGMNQGGGAYGHQAHKSTEHRASPSQLGDKAGEHCTNLN